MFKRYERMLVKITIIISIPSLLTLMMLTEVVLSSHNLPLFVFILLI